MSSTEKFESFNWIRGVADDKRITHLQRLILIRLVAHRGKDGRCDPGYDLLAKELGADRKTVVEAVDVGVRLGWLAPPIRGRRANANFIFTFPDQDVPSSGTSRADQDVPPNGTSRAIKKSRFRKLRSPVFRVKKSVKKEASQTTSKASTRNGHLTGKENGQVSRTRAVIDCRTKIAKAFEQATGRPPPDTGYVEVWAAQGYDLTLCAAVAAEVLARKTTDVTSLKYFDKPIAEAHAKRPASSTATATNGAAAYDDAKPDDAELKKRVLLWARTGGRNGGLWNPNWRMPAPHSSACTIPQELIEECLKEAHDSPSLTNLPAATPHN